MTENKLTPEQIVAQLLQQKTEEKEPERPLSVTATAGPKPKVTVKLQSHPFKEQHYYDVKVECMLPAVVTYRVLAEDPMQAADKIKGMSPNGVKHRLIGKKDLKLTVYDAGGSMIRWAKNLLGV